MKLSEYLLLSREERTSHIDLSTPCKPNPRVKRPPKSDILLFLGIEDDLENWVTSRVHRCHLCETSSTKGWCINPLHLYIGTPAENIFDVPKELRSANAIAGGKKIVIERVGIHDPEYKKSNECLKQRRDAAEKTKQKLSKAVVCLETGMIYPSIIEAHRQTGISLSGISRSARSGGKRACGEYHWIFNKPPC